MAHLLDTNILVRLANKADANHDVAEQAVMKLHRRGEALYIAPQVLIEFRNVATRPTALNGLGRSTIDAETLESRFEGALALLPETPDIFPAWKTLVRGLGVTGKQVHDARIVAICHVYRVSHLLTFNVSHFVRMMGFGPGIVVVDPANV